jgi:hypothetical protein
MWGGRAHRAARRQIAPSDRASGRNFLRLRRRNHLRSRRNDDVRSRRGQPGTLVGLWLFHRCGRADHIGRGKGCRLVGLRSPRHDAGRSFSITPRAAFRSRDNSRGRHSFRPRRSAIPETQLPDVRLARHLLRLALTSGPALVRPLPFQNALPTHDLRHDPRKTAWLT